MGRAAPSEWPVDPAPTDERLPVRWMSGAKDGVGTSVGAQSRVWFSITRGVVSEVFYPSVDHVNLRRMYIVVVAPGRTFVDGTTNAYRVRAPAPWTLAYDVRTRIPFAGLTLQKRIITDPRRSVLLQYTRLRGGDATSREARVFVIVEPHLDNDGAGNDGWLGEYKGVPALLARGESTALAVVCSRPLIDGVCTYAGRLDAVAELQAHGHLTRTRASAMDGNVQIAAEVALDETREFVLAMGFGGSADHAAQQARSALQSPFHASARSYVRGWQRHHARHARCPVSAGARVDTVFDASVALLRAHQDKERAGAIIASMAIPWGDAHGDDGPGSYHLVWPRDLVASAEALLAVGRPAVARRALAHLMSTQEADGMWPHNMWIDGAAHMRGTELDEVALPVLLARMLARHGALRDLEPWPMVRSAAGYLVRAGPSTPEDRWEEEGGYSPYTMAAEIAALLAAAAFADEAHEPALAAYLRETADDWVALLDRLTYVRDTPLSHRHDVDGYYVRLTPPAAVRDGRAVPRTPLRLLNQPCVTAELPYEEVVSADALALVRFGIVAADDERIRNTLVVVDAGLRVRTKRGPSWHRYTGDGYGETEDGAPHLAWGIGRAWPLLTGERAHYEVARGRLDRATRLLRAMAAQANPSGLLPEQIWDAEDIPARGLFNGRPTGSAMPLMWAHAEFLKLCRSIADGRVFDTPTECVERYRGRPSNTSRVTWRPDRPLARILRGASLRIEARDARRIEWRVDDDRHGHADASDPGVGISHADLPTADLAPGTTLRFRICGDDGAQPREHAVRIVEPDAAARSKAPG